MDNCQHIRWSQVVGIDERKEKIVHLLMIDVDICPKDLPLLGKEVLHALFACEEIIEKPSDMLVQFRRIVQKRVPSRFKLSASHAFNSLKELFLVSSNGLRTNGK